MKWTIGLGLLTVIGYMGCTSGDNSPNVSAIPIALERVDFDEAFLALDAGGNLKSEVEILRSKYPSMTELYINNVMQFKRPRDTTELYLVDIKGFLQSPDVINLKGKIDSVFTDRSELDAPFRRAFQYLKHYFPNRSIPKLYYMMTEYSYAAFIFRESAVQDGLGISLDMFLGKNYPYKRLFPTNAAFSAYLTNTFDPAYVVKKGIDAVIDDLVGSPPGERMIDIMIHNGKKQYILEQLIPQAQDSILWEYTSEQMTWVEDNELNLYTHFTSQKMLYSEDYMKYNKFVNPSPNAPGLPAEAPGRTANYIGYKIIQAYMEKSGASLEQLVEDRETQHILNLSRYKPSL